MRKDISGQRFGKLVAIQPLRTEKKLGTIWQCQCDCGNYVEVPVSRLTSGNTKSCGCIKAKQKKDQDITGQRFGRLVAVKFCYFDEQYKDYWLFHCDCGNEKILAAGNVKWGNVRSCGCLLTEHAKSMRTRDISGQRFGKLTAIRPTEERDAAGAVIWECDCDCGNKAYYSINRLRLGKAKSCGCLRKRSKAPKEELVLK